MPNVYRQNAANGANEGFVEYYITPDLGQPVYPGDIVTIVGSVYSRDFNIRSMNVRLGYTTNSSTTGFSANLSVAKGKIGTFSFTFSMPEMNVGDERQKSIYMIFSTFDLPNNIYKNGGIVCFGVNEYHINYLNYKLLPNVSNMDFERSDANGNINNEGLYFKCLGLKISISELANADDITVASIESSGSDGTKNTITLDKSVIQSALSEGGYSESAPKIFSGASLIGVTYTLTLTIGDEYEKIIYADTVPRAFANLHLSGAKSGGAAFGMFSTSIEGDPKLESAYPAHFYGGFGEETIKLIGNVVYPVGAIFICDSNTFPEDVFGGKWEQIKDKFIVASGNSFVEGETGGSAAYALSVSHKHLSPAGFAGGILGVVNIADSVQIGYGLPYASVVANYSGVLDRNTTLGYTAEALVSANIPTIPPYIAVCIWKRTELYIYE